ncbi:hypothetical protein BGX31_006754 [Mortierella sp. GBA43]|nr:hypothetical protein BGX31_006754 [Mortierella sp. GBA43]
MLGGTLPLLKSSPSPHQILQLTDVFLENAYKTDDNNVAVMLCHHAGMALSQAKAAAKKTDTTRTDLENQAMRERIANAYLHLGKLLENKGYEQDAKTFYKKCEKLGGTIQDPGQFVPGPTDNASDTAAASSADVAIVPSTGMDATTVPMNIFIGNVRPPIMFKPPGSDERLGDTQQLACCLGLLKDPISTEDIVDSAVRDWLQTTQSDSDEQERLEALANDVLRAFKRDEIKDTKAMTEVLYLAPFLGKDDFQYLLKEFCFEIERSKLLDIHKLGGLARLIQGANHDHLNADDLVRILQLLSSRLKDTHRQSPSHRYELTRAVSCILDAMADVKIKGLDRETIHEPLSSYLNKLKNSEDAYLVYQAAYAYQALLYVPDDELLWQAVLRRTGKVIKGVSGLVSVVKGLDLSAFIESLKDIQQGFAGVSDVVQHIKTAVLLAQSGQSFLECLKGGLSFSRKCAWYSALRGADTFICGGQLAKFRKLVCEAPCRRDQAFQWGICQRLGELAANTTWDLDTRKSAVAFLGEIYQKDDEWGYHATVKQLTLNILMQLSLLSMDDMEY